MLNFPVRPAAVLVAALLVSASPVAFALKQASPTPAAPVARPAAPPALTATERTQILKDAAKAITAVKTARGNFEQIAPDRTRSTGRFALARPGKVRFEYNAPMAFLIVSDGKTVALQDTELKSTDRVPLGSTPLSLLLDSKLDFDKKAKVESVTREGGVLAIALSDPKGDVEGTLTLLLDEKTKALTGWRVRDGDRNETLVKLSAVETGKTLNPKLFIAKDFDAR